MALEPFKFADNDDEAAEKYERYKNTDPFPSIAPALLNSADIENYVAATGMIHPFDSGSEGRLKPASYRIDIKGDCLYWDENNEKKEFKILEGDEITIKPNSIVFIGVEPFFRLPDYIALRFNLQITHVYKGLLVGTGPLVDPGFVGKLWLPLHNLTANPYTLKGGDPIIWMEFTKLSTINLPNSKNDLVEKGGKFEDFPARKTGKELDYYLEKAVGRDRVIRSSIPLAIKEAEQNAQKAAQDANEAKEKIDQAKQTSEKTALELKEHKSSVDIEVNKLNIETSGEIEKLKAQVLFISPILSGVVAIFLLLVTYYNIVYPINALVQTSTDRFSEWGNRYSRLERQTNDLEKQIANIQIQNTQKPTTYPTASNTNASSNPVEEQSTKQDLNQLKTDTENDINSKLSKINGELQARNNFMFWMLIIFIFIILLIFGAQFYFGYNFFVKKNQRNHAVQKQE
jgi:deoxycytidine triphosphate deaminase